MMIKTMCDHPPTSDMSEARDNALQHQNVRERVNCYWLHGPVPRVMCRPIVDYPGNVKAQDAIVELILEGAGHELFDWDDTPEAVAHNRLSASRWAVIHGDKKPRPRPPVARVIEPDDDDWDAPF